MHHANCKDINLIDEKSGSVFDCLTKTRVFWGIIPEKLTRSWLNPLLHQSKYYLTPGELERLRNYHKPEDMAVYAFSHLKVRRLMAEFLSSSAHKNAVTYQFYENSRNPFVHDKPRSFIDGKEFPFSLSHSGRAYAIAFGPAEIGVDIEYDRNFPEELIGTDIFTKKELQYLIRLKTSERNLNALRLWVRKEALLKATGFGIPYGLNKVEVLWERSNGYTALNGLKWMISDIATPLSTITVSVACLQ